VNQNSSDESSDSNSDDLDEDDNKKTKDVAR
jgi:hypothetical protein